MTPQEFLDALVPRLKDLYLQSYGEAEQSDSDDSVLNADLSNQWKPIVNMGVSSKFFFQNLSTTDEVMWTWNKNAKVGFRVKKNEGFVLDNVSGIFYAKPSDPTKTITVNWATIGLVVRK